MQFFDEIEAEAAEVGARVRKACQEMRDPEPQSMFDNVYTGSTRPIEAERAGFAAYLDSFVDEEAGR
jgi:2-oxoisovalerate dehydrogenase E1 component alpha subunit